MAESVPAWRTCDPDPGAHEARKREMTAQLHASWAAEGLTAVSGDADDPGVLANRMSLCDACVPASAFVSVAARLREEWQLDRRDRIAHDAASMIPEPELMRAAQHPRGLLGYQRTVTCSLCQAAGRDGRGHNRRGCPHK